MKPCDHNIKRTIELTQEMIRLADQGDSDREDIGCGILYGMLRDSAYKLWRMAEDEKKRHQAKGWWSNHCPSTSETNLKTEDSSFQHSKDVKED